MTHHGHVSQYLLPDHLARQKAWLIAYLQREDVRLNDFSLRTDSLGHMLDFDLRTTHLEPVNFPGDQ